MVLRLIGGGENSVPPSASSAANPAASRLRSSAMYSRRKPFGSSSTSLSCGEARMRHSLSATVDGHARAAVGNAMTPARSSMSQRA